MGEYDDIMGNSRYDSSRRDDRYNAPREVRTLSLPEQVNAVERSIDVAGTCRALISEARPSSGVSLTQARANAQMDCLKFTKYTTDTVAGIRQGIAQSKKSGADAIENQNREEVAQMASHFTPLHGIVKGLFADTIDAAIPAKVEKAASAFLSVAAGIDLLGHNSTQRDVAKINGEYSVQTASATQAEQTNISVSNGSSSGSSVGNVSSGSTSTANPTLNNTNTSNSNSNATANPTLNNTNTSNSNSNATANPTLNNTNTSTNTNDNANTNTNSNTNNNTNNNANTNNNSNANNNANTNNNSNANNNANNNTNTNNNTNNQTNNGGGDVAIPTTPTTN